MKTVYLVRHGESEENLGGILQGEHSPLTEKGNAQAASVAERCTRLGATSLVTSSMVRAQETAAYISSATGLQIEVSAIFTERIFPSSVIGKATDDPAVREKMDRWSSSMYGESDRVEDGEDFAIIKQRALKALAMLESHESDSIILVSHGFFSRVLMAVIVFGDSLTGSELKKLSYALRTKNTGITVLSYSETAERAWEDSPGWKIRVFNDHAHLG